MAQRPRISHCRCGFRRPTPASFKQVHARHSAAIKWHSVGPANMMCSFEEARRMKIVAALVVALGASSAFSADDPNTAVAAGIVRMSASMNEMALACKHMPSQKVDEAKAKQKSATLSTFWLGMCFHASAISFIGERKSTPLNSNHHIISYSVFFF